jgi:hypothetical protein
MQLPLAKLFGKRMSTFRDLSFLLVLCYVCSGRKEEEGGMRKERAGRRREKEGRRK